MQFSEKQKMVMKKTAICLLRLAGGLLVLYLLADAGDHLYQAQLELYGPADFVGRISVIYLQEWDFLYTNPMAMVGRNFRLLFMIAGGVAAAAILPVLLSCGSRRQRKIKMKDRFLLAALLYAAAVWGVFFRYDVMTHDACESFFHQADACHSLADYETLCGKSVWSKTVGEKNRDLIDTLAYFKKSGFAPGRKLHLFEADRPAVYLLVWTEKDKVVQRDWCHKSSAEPDWRSASKFDRH